jgi:hypothetical protein
MQHGGGSAQWSTLNQDADGCHISPFYFFQFNHRAGFWLETKHF